MSTSCNQLRHALLSCDARPRRSEADPLRPDWREECERRRTQGRLRFRIGGVNLRWKDTRGALGNMQQSLSHAYTLWPYPWHLQTSQGPPVLYKPNTLLPWLVPGSHVLIVCFQEKLGGGGNHTVLQITCHFLKFDHTKCNFKKHLCRICVCKRIIVPVMTSFLTKMGT